VAGISSRFPQERIEELRRELKDAVAAVHMALPQPSEAPIDPPAKARGPRVIGMGNGSARRPLGAGAH
jgi:hypothetical protein